jgi:hypothetical protein
MSDVGGSVADEQSIATTNASLKAFVADENVDWKEKYTKNLPDNIRAFVTRWVIIVFLGYIASVGLYIIIGSNTGDHAVTTEKTANLMEIAKILLLPVVTFVIGHYFGSKADRN